MTRWQKIKAVGSGILTVLLAPFLLLDPEIGCTLIVILLGISALVTGIRLLVYYILMTRHMVGGKLVLYQGIVLVDFGLFTIGFAQIPTRYIMIYLLIGYLFGGLVDLLRSAEIRKRQIGFWRLKALMGAGNLAIGLLCLVFLDSTGVMLDIYCFGLVWAALGKILSALRSGSSPYAMQP